MQVAVNERVGFNVGDTTAVHSERAAETSKGVRDQRSKGIAPQRNGRHRVVKGEGFNRGDPGPGQTQRATPQASKCVGTQDP